VIQRRCYVGHLTLLGLTVLAAGSLVGQEKFDSLRRVWEQGEYAAVLPGLIALQKDPAVDQFKLDYMIGASLCRSAERDYRTKGVEFYDTVLRRAQGRLQDDAVAGLRQERDECAATLATTRAMGPPPPVKIIAYRQQPRAEVRITGGKEMPTWVLGECVEERPLAEDPFEVLDTLPDSLLASRLFRQSQGREAIEAALARLANSQAGKFAADTVGHFLLVSASGPANAWLREVGRYLEGYLDFFATHFTMRIPDSLFTVYLVPGEQQLRILARFVHRLKPSQPVIGYSVFSDLSIAAINLNAPSGTLTHELMHLMLKLNYREVPPWLDEGLAALYEVSSRQGNVILGRPNWRGVALQRFWLPTRKPKLVELFGADIEQFEQAQGSGVNQALNFAMSRYFVLFLQNRQKLTEVYQAIQRRPRITYRKSGVLEIRDDSGKGTVKFIASVLGIPENRLQDEFERWMIGVLPSDRREPCPS
jgi:hypothetical protein